MDFFGRAVFRQLGILLAWRWRETCITAGDWSTYWDLRTLFVFLFET
jgi:hypothetical protein